MAVYKTGWIKEHLGITRKMIINMEKAELLPKHTAKEYRNFTYDEVKMIWIIKVMHDIGLTYVEIKDYINYLTENQDNIINDDYFPKLLEKCVNNLKQEIAEKKKSVEYASTIMLTGSFPAFPKNFGEVTAEKFNKIAKEEYSNEGRQAINYSELRDTFNEMIKSGIDYTNNETVNSLIDIFKKMFEFVDTAEESITLSLLFKISRYRNLGPESDKVQTLIDLMYDFKNDEEGNVYTKQFFAAKFISFITNGLVGIETRKQMGDDNYMFTLDALMYYGQFKNISEADDLLVRIETGKVSKYADGHIKKEEQ